MALVVDTTVRFMNPPSGQNFTFKLSKPLNQLTIDDIKSQDAYVGFTNFAINTIGEGVLSQGSPVNNPNHCYMWATDDSSLYSDINEVGHWCNPPAFPDGVYMRNILVYAPLTISNNGSFIKADSASRIVIDITPDANTSMQKLAIGSDGRLVCWYSNDTLSENRVDNYYYIYPAILFEINDTTYIYTQELSPRWASFYINSILDQGFNSNTARVNFNNESYHRLAYGWTVGATSIGENFFTKFDENRQIENYNINGHTVTFKVNVGASNYHWRVSESMTDNADQTVTKQYYANTGFRFKIDNVWYKPIISDGIVTGYTDDMTVQSEWDTWTKASGHNVPSGPPSPTPPEGDSYANMGLGTGTNVGGLTNYAIMSLNDLVDLIGDFNVNLKTGQSIEKNFICCYKLGPLASELCTTNSSWIVMSAYSTEHNNFVSQREDYAIVSAQKQSVTLGEYVVPRKTGTFYDFAPYSTYECFIPCCGWVPLPDTVAGRKITVYLVFDLASCCCKGMVRLGDGTTVAEVSGVIGSPVPFQINDSGIARAAHVQAIAQSLSGLAMGAVGAYGGNPSLITQGSIQAANGMLSMYINGNTNYTSVKGSNGDISQFANGEYCTIKITHPVVDEVVDNSMYGHTVGYICNEVGTVSDFSGFTVFLNPHVTGFSCTREEKDEIESLLSDGIIITTPEE